MNASHAEAIARLRGCIQMLRESAKQHRLNGDKGHARMCEAHINAAIAALKKAEGNV